MNKSLRGWRILYPREYAFACKNNLIDVICEKNRWIYNKKIHKNWNFETCIEDAKKFDYLNDWRNTSSYYFANKHKDIIPLCINHMKGPNSNNKNVNYEYCLEGAKRRQTFKNWVTPNHLDHHHTYIIAKRMGWVDNIKKIVFNKKGILRKEYKKKYDENRKNGIWVWWSSDYKYLEKK